MLYAIFGVLVIILDQWVKYWAAGNLVYGGDPRPLIPGIINLLKSLESTLRNGRDAVTRQQIGLQTGDIDIFQTFEDLFAAYTRQVEYFVQALAEQEMMEYQVAGNAAPFLYLSMLYDDCLERGKALFPGAFISWAALWKPTATSTRRTA